MTTDAADAHRIVHPDSDNEVGSRQIGRGKTMLGGLDKRPSSVTTMLLGVMYTIQNAMASLDGKPRWQMAVCMCQLATARCLFSFMLGGLCYPRHLYHTSTPYQTSI